MKKNCLLLNNWTIAFSFYNMLEQSSLDCELRPRFILITGSRWLWYKWWIGSEQVDKNYIKEKFYLVYIIVALNGRFLLVGCSHLTANNGVDRDAAKRDAYTVHIHHKVRTNHWERAFVPSYFPSHMGSQIENVF